jgi:hypothetical protein
MLSCDDRVEVRQFITDVTSTASPCPSLVKVKAHDAHGLALGHPMAVGNDLADAWAKAAANDPSLVHWQPGLDLHGDPVELCDGTGSWVASAKTTFPAAWWQMRSQRASSRSWLRKLYPPAVAVDWANSTVIFRRTVYSGGVFVHTVEPSVVKWMARVRAGSLNTRLRVHTRFRQGSPACLCCGAAEEDDEHAVAGCPATGTSDWRALVAECWTAATRSAAVTVPPPAPDWLAQHHLQLLAALIPVTIAAQLSLPPPSLVSFCQRLHRELAVAVAERLRRRQVMLSTCQATAPAVPSPVASPQPGAGLQVASCQPTGSSPPAPFAAWRFSTVQPLPPLYRPPPFWQPSPRPLPQANTVIFGCVVVWRGC